MFSNNNNNWVSITLLKNLWIENRSSSRQSKSVHGLQTSLFIRDAFWLQTLVAVKLLRTAIWSGCAVRFDSKQTPFFQTDFRFRPAALQKFRFTWTKCNKVLLFPSKILSSVTCQCCHCPKLQSTKTLSTLESWQGFTEVTQYLKSGSTVSSSEQVAMIKFFFSTKIHFFSTSI